MAQDYAEAMTWFRKAADQGYAQAQSNLGAVYEKGLGVARDYAEGRHIDWPMAQPRALGPSASGL